MPTHYLIDLHKPLHFALSPSQSYTLGADPKQADLVIEDDSISPLHAKIFFLDGKWHLQDLQSAEGSYLAQQPLTPHKAYPLPQGTRLSLGFRDLAFSRFEPLLRADDNTPTELANIGEERDLWQHLSPTLRLRWLTDALQEIVSTEKEAQDYLHESLRLFRSIFQPAILAASLEDLLCLEGIQQDDAFAEIITREARFQITPHAFRSAARQESGYRALCAPLLLHDLARGYLYLVASPDAPPWSQEDFALFTSLCRLLSQGLSIRDNLRKAREAREVLHLNLVGIAPAMEELKIRLLQIAQQDTPALVIGEDGVGKSRFARAIHQASPRRQAPLMVLNAANFPKELFELAIFGSVESLPLSQPKRDGKALLAHQGSFLIEEIGEIPLGIQPSLIALVQSKMLQPLGATQSLPCDIRLLATSRLPLDQLVKQEKLLPELAEIFQQGSLTVPPLRQRKEDIPQLFRAFLARLGEEEGLPTAVVADDALALLKGHRWASNIRELRKVVSFCFYELDPEHPIIHAQLVEKALQSLQHNEPAPTNKIAQATAALEIRMIQEALMAANDDIHEAARSLGISLVILRQKMRPYGIG